MKTSLVTNKLNTHIITTTKMKLLTLLMVLLSSLGWGQSTANYTLTSGASSLNVMTGSTSLISGNNDDWASGVFPIGFNFIYMGTSYSHISVNSNGQARLHTSSGATAIGTSGVTSYASATVTLAPMGGDNEVNNGISYLVSGSAPNRKLIIEWNQFYAYYTNITTSGNMQLVLNESNGAIEFLYGSIFNSQAATTSNSIFHSSSNTANSSAFVTIAATPTQNTSATSPTTNAFAASVQIANLANRFLTFTPTTPNNATALNFTSVGISSMVLNWTDASNELSYLLERSSDGGTTWTTITTLPANTITYSATNLSGNTAYSWRIKSFGEGSYSSGIIGSQTTLSCPTFSSTITIGGTTTPGSSYSTLTAAIADIKACGITQPTILELSSTYSSGSETFPITLSSITGASATNTLTIRPAVGATGLVITSTNTTATIDINGGQYWVIDGRLGGTGAADLALGNTGTAPAIRFINDGANNVVKYSNITSSVTSTTSGLIFFSTTTGSVGNDNNTIDNCNLNGGGTVANIIYASGSTNSSAVNNSGVIISNNVITDQFRAGSSTNGILVSSGNTDWTISGNSFYQTATRTYTSGSTHSGINISNSSGNNFIITGNFIGGTSASCGGSAMTMTGSGLTQNYHGILLSVGSTTATSVQNNTIKNISFNTQSTGVFNGISITAGNANIGNLTANTVGANTGIGSIIFQTNTITGPVFTGINSSSSGTVTISNNNVGSVNLITASANTLIANFYGVRVTAGTTTTISSNIIGSTTTSNSINNTGGQNTTTNASIMRGISYEGSGTVVISSNTISNMAYGATGGTGPSSAVSLRGIHTTGIATISNNIISNLTNISGNTGTTSSAATIGIVNLSTNSGAWSISQNTIFGLSSLHSSAAVLTTGIFYNGSSTSGIIDRNLIYDLDAANASATLSGIHVGGGTATYQNNIVRLGTNGTSNTVGMNINGIFEPLGTDNMYHNSVYIGGAPSTGANASYAFNSQQTTNIRIFRNNIFVNARSNNGATSKHYSVRVGGTGTNPTGLTTNYNIYLATGTGGVLGYFNSADQTTLTGWQTATGQDANSKNASPCLANPTGSTPDLHLTDCSTAGSPAESAGINIVAVTDDFDGQLRSSLTPTDIGADAGNYGPSGIDMRVATLVSPTAGGCKTATESVSVSISNLSTNPIDFSVNNVTVSVTANGGYSSSVILSSGTLAAGSSQTVTMPATIDLTVSGTYTFNANTSVTGDVNTSNDAMTAVNIVLSSLGGTYTVGTAGTYTSLSAAINAVNNATCITAPIVLSLTDASYNLSSTPLVINNNANLTSTNTLTIKPATGVTSTITGSVASGALIVLNGADFVIIDGSNSGGTDKSLTISNTSTSNATGIFISSLGSGTGATNNTIKNCTINVNSSLSQQTTGISVAGATINSIGADNDNITIQNNTINSPGIGIYAMGTASTSTGGLDNVTIAGNNIATASSSASTSVYGIELSNALNASISSNVLNLLTSGATTPVAISIETGVTNTSINNNQIQSCTTTATGGYGGRGIAVGTGSTSSNITLSNNMIAGVNGSNYSSFGNSSSVGIIIGVVGNSTTLTNSTGGVNIFHNTINMSGNYSYSASCLTSALYLGSNVSQIDVRNNILVNSLNNTNSSGTGSKNYAIYSAAPNTIYTNINSNNYSVSGSQGMLGYITSDQSTLTSLTTAFGGNTNSINSVPTFVSATDLHLNTLSNCGLDNKGSFIANVTTDIDGTTRSNSTPDMGADEFTFSASSISWTGGASTTNPATAGNWNPATVPSICSNIDIPSGLTFYPTYTSLEIGAGVTLTVQSGARLTVNGTLTNNGTLTLESGATLVQGTGNTVAGSGTFNVKQALTGAGGATPSGRFWYLGSPVSGATSTVFNAAGDNRLWTFAEATQSYTEITTNGVSMSPMQGHVARLGANETSIFTGGLLNTGNYTNSSLTNTGTGSTRGYTLLSNPYPSYLDWTAAYTAAVATNVNLSSSIWYRSNDGTNMVYDIYNATGAIATNNSGGTTTQYIPPMQAFWVYNPNDGTTGSVTFSNSMRSHQNNGGLKSITDFPAFVRLNLENDGAIDQTVLYFDNNAATGYDNFDSDKMMVSNAAQVYSFVDNKKLAINGMKSVKTNKQVPLTVEFPTAKGYSFNATEVAMTDGIVILEDRLMNVFQDLTMNPVYAFDAVAGTDANRFVVHFQANSGVAGIETAEENGIDIVSNASGLVTITLSEELPAMGTIQIIDINGKVIATQAINEQTTTMNINATTGVYHVLVDSSAKVARKKIVITK